MDPFGSVPVHVRLLQQKPCPQAIRCEFGLVAIIDISGYSTLSSELEAILGPESGAKIKELINPPMERIIETVHSYDGSVVKFAGDAVIVSWCFPPTTLSTETLNFDAITDSDERSLTAKALSACVQLLIQFKDYKIWIGNSPRLLKIHIGLGLGEIDHIHIGSNQVSATIDQSNRREYFISGKALSLAGTFLNLGEKGDLVFSKTIESMLYQRFRKKGAYSCILSERDALEDILDEVSLYSFGAVSLGPCEDAAASAPRDDASFNHMLLYMDDAIRHHLAAPGKPRSLHLNDQIRSVSVVFIKFLEVHSESVAEPQNLDKIQAAMVAVIKECVEFQGSLRQFNCDDKSLTALLVWGLEGMAHEKGEHAFAVLAAKAIAKALDKFMKQEYAIGVTSGFALSGVVGSRCRYDHTILGVVVNNAARLMSLDQCHGIVLCDKDTYEATKESLTFKTDLPKVSIKGVNGQVEIFSPITSHIRESAAVNSVQRLYGRESEMSIIEKSIRNWRMGKNESKSANNLAIIGPSGLGKTQLISWFKTKASENGIVCNGACQEHKREGILFVFGSILRSLLEHLGKRQCKLLKKLEYAYTTKLAAKREQQRRSSMIPSTSSRLSDALHTAQPQPSDVSEAEGVGILSNVVVAFKDSRDQGLATPTNSGTIGKGKSVLAAKLNKIGLAAVIREEQKDEELERKTMELLVRVLTAISLPMSALEMLRIIPGISSQTFAQDSVLEGLAARLSAIIATLLNSISDAEIHISLCIDDVQWCDSHSLELLTHLVQKCPNTLFVIGARPFEEWKITLKDMAHQLLYSNNITVLNLQPLERHHVEQILKDTFQDYEFSSIEPQLLSHIMEKAQGSPLVTLILIRQLQKEKLFEVVDSIAKCSDYNLFAELVDKGVSSVVVAQLDKVNSTLRRILKVGALSAQRFSIADVLTVVRMIDSECELTTAAELVEFIRQSDTFDLIKISETEDEVHFSNYLIQQGVLSVMLATERQTIHLGFVELFEKKLERMDPKSPKTAPVRHLLLSHLMQIPGEDEKKRKHVYQAFLDAAEMRQTVEAFHYFDLYSSIKISEEPDKSCYKIVRECRLLAQLYYDKGEPAKAIQKTHEAFQALGCRRKYLIGTNLMLLLSACRLVKETEKVLQLENSAKREAAVRAFYSTTFPKAIVKMDAKIHPESNRASTDGQGDSNEFPFAEEIEALLWTAGSACLSFKPNVQGLLLSLLYLGPAMIAKSDRDFRLCRYLMGMSMSAYAFGFKKLSSICQQVGLPIMKELLQKDADTLTEYQSYLFKLRMAFDLHTFILLKRDSAPQKRHFT
ncbi:hypothetical protein BC830DRAFT_34383 [Chytriomyces sp. MP71]|nr:hypothetical protein BC830DRAFT_34383 [Chytriomyces sp. MP71]